MEPAIIIMSKVPLPGMSKTRLRSMLSAQDCVDFHRACLYDLTASLEQLGWPLYLYYTARPDYEDYTDNTWWGLEAAIYARTSFCPQRGQNLGGRMYNAAREVLSEQKAVILLGTDLPDLSIRVLKQARAALLKHDVVIGPAEDGGYYLLGIKQAYPGLFTDIAWGSSQVLAETLARIEMNGLNLAMLETARDLDTPEDLEDYYQRGQQDPAMQKLRSYPIIRRIIEV